MDFKDGKEIANRLSSVICWKYRCPVRVGGGSGMRVPEKPEYTTPRRNGGGESKYHRTRSINFDYLDDLSPKNKEQEIALALYRDAITAEMPSIQVLTFYKILEPIGNRDAWIDAREGRITEWNKGPHGGTTKDHIKWGSNLGEYLRHICRNAVAHYILERDPAKGLILDLDNPDEEQRLSRAARMLQQLAEIYIEEELKLPSLSKIWREHLYELRGFKQLLGREYIQKVIDGTAISEAPPKLPRVGLFLNTTETIYKGLDDLNLQPTQLYDKVLVLRNVEEDSPVNIAIALDFQNERLLFMPTMAELNIGSSRCTPEFITTYFEFLKAYLYNGRLIIRNNETGDIITKLESFVPLNIDVQETIESWSELVKKLQE
jgi:hypothetical protein